MANESLNLVLGLTVDESQIGQELEKARKTLEKLLKGTLGDLGNIGGVENVFKEMFSLKGIGGGVGSENFFNKFKKTLTDNIKSVQSEVEKHGTDLEKQIVETVSTRTKNALNRITSKASKGTAVEMRKRVLEEVGLTRTYNVGQTEAGGRLRGSLEGSKPAQESLKQLGLHQKQISDEAKNRAQHDLALIDKQAADYKAFRDASTAKRDAFEKEKDNAYRENRRIDRARKKKEETLLRAGTVEDRKLDKAADDRRAKLRKDYLAQYRTRVKARGVERRRSQILIDMQVATYKEAGVSDFKIAEAGNKATDQFIKSKGSHVAYRKALDFAISDDLKEAKRVATEKKKHTENLKVLRSVVLQARKQDKASTEDVKKALKSMTNVWDPKKPGSPAKVVSSGLKTLRDAFKSIKESGEIKDSDDFDFTFKGGGSRRLFGLRQAKGTEISGFAQEAFQERYGIGSGTTSRAGLAERFGGGAGGARKVAEAAKDFQALNRAVQSVTAGRGNLGEFQRIFNRTLKTTNDFGYAAKFAAREANSFFGGLQGQVARLAFKIGIGRQFVGMLTGMARGLAQGTQRFIELSKASAEYRDQQEGFSRLVRSVAESNDQLVNTGVLFNQIREAAGGTIDEMALMQSATQGVLAGIAPDKIAEIVAAARTLASVTGRDASEAFTRLTNAIAKQERRLLDELGVVVRANDLYEEYADKHNIVASAMTAQQKQAAFLEGTLEKVNEKVQSLGGAIEANQRIFIDYEKSIRNLKLSFGEWIGTSEFGIGVVETLTDVFRDWGERLKTETQRAIDFSSVLQTLETRIGSMNELLNAPVRSEGSVFESAIDHAIAISRQLGGADPTTRAYANAEEALEGYVLKFRKYAPELGAYLTGLTGGHESFREELEGFRQTLQDMVDTGMGMKTDLFKSGIQGIGTNYQALQKIQDEALQNQEDFYNKNSKLAEKILLKTKDTSIDKKMETAAMAAGAGALGGAVLPMVMTAVGTAAPPLGAAIAGVAVAGGLVGWVGSQLREDPELYEQLQAMYREEQKFKNRAQSATQDLDAFLSSQMDLAYGLLAVDKEGNKLPPSQRGKYLESMLEDAWADMGGYKRGTGTKLEESVRKIMATQEAKAKYKESPSTTIINSLAEYMAKPFGGETEAALRFQKNKNLGLPGVAWDKMYKQYLRDRIYPFLNGLKMFADSTSQLEEETRKLVATFAGKKKDAGATQDQNKEKIIQSVQAAIQFQEEVGRDISQIVKDSLPGFTEEDSVSLMKVLSKFNATPTEIAEFVGANKVMNRQTFELLRKAVQGASGNLMEVTRKVLPKMTKELLKAGEEIIATEEEQAETDTQKKKLSLLQRRVGLFTEALGFTPTGVPYLTVEITNAIQKRIDETTAEIGSLKASIAEKARKATERERERTLKDAERVRAENTRNLFEELKNIITDNLGGLSKTEVQSLYDRILRDGKINYAEINKLISSGKGHLAELRGLEVQRLYELATGTELFGDQATWPSPYLMYAIGAKLEDRDFLKTVLFDQARARDAVTKELATEAKKSAKKLAKDLADSILDGHQTITSEFKTQIVRIRTSGEPIIKQMEALERLAVPSAYAPLYGVDAWNPLTSTFDDGTDAGKNALERARDMDKRSQEQKDRFKLRLGERYQTERNEIMETINDINQASREDGRALLEKLNKQAKDLGIPSGLSGIDPDVGLLFGDLMGIGDTTEAGKQYQATVESVLGAREKATMLFMANRLARQRESTNELAIYRITKEKMVEYQNRDAYEEALEKKANFEDGKIRATAKSNFDTNKKLTDDLAIHWAKFYDARDEREKKYREDTIKGAQSVVNILNQVIPTETGQQVTQMIGQFVGLRNQLVQTASLFGETMTVATAEPIAAMLLFASHTYKIWKEGADRAKEISRKTTEAIKAQKDALIQQAREVGSAMGSEMSKGLILDPQQFLKQMVQSQMAKILGDLFSTAMAQPFQNVKMSLMGIMGDKNVMTKDILSNVDLYGNRINESSRVSLRRRISGVMSYEERLRRATSFMPGFAREGNLLQAASSGGKGILGDIDPKKQFTDEELNKLMARAMANEMISNPNLKAGTEKFKNVATETRTRLQEGFDFINEMFGLSEASSATGQYGVPTATFSAVTEPQANNMLVMMTRQVNYLARIATNTDFLPQIALAQNIGGVGIATAPAIIAADDINAQLEQKHQGLG